MFRVDNRERLGACDLIGGGRAKLAVVKLHQRAGVEEVPWQRSTVPALGNNFGSHRPGNFSEAADILHRARGPVRRGCCQKSRFAEP